MKGDFTNIRRQPQKHYSSVRNQQGRVALDVDWNDQIELQNHLDRTAAVDVIGQAGVPKGAAGFQIDKNVDASDLTISAGRCWVDGLLCEIDQATTYLTQPALPNPPLVSAGALALNDGTYVVYLDAWEDHVTDLDDPDLQEPALRGVDTTTRTQVLWQVKLLAVADPSSAGTCDTAFPEWAQVIAPPSGMLSARAQATVDATACNVDSGGGYRRLENQLYRVEVHQAGDQTSATFKWSRENGSVVAAWTKLTGNVLGVSSPGRDAVVGFSEGDWIELTDDDHERSATPGVLVKITKVAATELTIDTTSFDPSGTVLDYANFPHHPKVRRWEADLPTATSAARPLLPSSPGDGFVDLEDGVQVKFENGSYGSGDYWVVPARTILGDVIWPVDPSTQTPLTQPRLGVAHHYARLALLRKAGAALTVTPCVALFPALTDLSAADVAYTPGCQALQGAGTVQAALDLLCQESDLAFHNQHLHGWGIVSGLQVTCGPDSTPPGGGAEVHDTVTVNNGYAIAGTGMDIVVDAKDGTGAPLPGDYLKVLDLIQTTNVLPTDPSSGKLQDGSVSLILDGGDLPGRYSVVPYDSTSQNWSSLLQNTFWMDVYQNTIVPIIDAFRDEFAGDPVAARAHVITFLNVLAQLINPNAGARVFISAKEDQILRDFYARLRGILQSKTFCAMFDGVVTNFPDYPPIYTAAAAASPGNEPSTIFIPGTLSVPQKLRVDPAGKVGYLVSGDINIQIFDLQPEVPTTGANGQPVFPGLHELPLSTTPFPAAGAVVKDLALSTDGKTLYALALASNNTDALFATADVSNPSQVTWTSAVTSLCSTPLTTLVYASSINSFYAIAPGKGLFQFTDPSNPTPNQQPLVAFSACGQLVVSEVGQQTIAFVTVGTAPTYTAVGRIDLRNVVVGPNGTPGSLPFTQTLPGSGSDDLGVAFDPSGRFQRMFVVVDGAVGQTSKQLLVYDGNNATNAAAAPLAQVPLRFIPAGTTPPSTTDTSIYRLSFDPGASSLLVLSTTDNVVQTYDIAQGGATLSGLVYPTQNAPVALAVSDGAGYAFVLNAVSSTINNVPLRYLAGTAPLVDLGALAQYHTQFLKTFIDLFGQSAQFLKDAICDQLLINNPDAGDKTIYLARIDVKNGEVYNICNFSRRKYVHSFPTVEYWMSVLPILPIIRKAVGDFCCTILQQKFFNYEPPAPASRADVVSGSTVVRSASAVQSFDVKSFISNEIAARFKTAGSVTATIAKNVAFRPAPLPSVAAASRFDLRNQPVANATRTLADQGVTVTGIEPARTGDLAGTFMAPSRLARGAKAVLVTNAESRVVAVKPAPAPAASTADLQAALAQRDQQISRLTGQLQQIQTDQQSALAHRDQQLATLASQMAEVQKRVGELGPAKPRTRRPPE